MKKIFSALSVLAVFACAVSFTSCDKIVDKIAPIQEWCEKDFNYSTGDKSTTVTVHFFYTEKDFDITNSNSYSENFKKSSKIKTNDDKSVIPAGLTLVAEASSENNVIEALSGKKYSVYILNEGVSYDENGDSKEDFENNEEQKKTPFKMSKNLWGLIYLHYYDELKDSTTKAPACIRTAGYEEATTDIDWEEILAQILIEKLLED